MPDIALILSILSGIAVLLVLILYFKIQAFLALLIAGIWVGLWAGMNPQDVIASMKSGMGSTLGFVATVVGLGALFGAILESSGGSQIISKFLLKTFGQQNAPWAMVIAGFIIAIPVFFDVAFIILIPVVYALQKSTGKSLLLYGLPLLAGLAITHSFIPPTPGPVAVAEIVGANLGMVILAGFITGIPCAIIAGPIFARWISKRIYVQVPEYIESSEQNDKTPSLPVVLLIIFIPIVLILINTFLSSPLFSQMVIPKWFEMTIALIGHPFGALILANVLAWYFLGLKQGFTKNELLTINSKSLAPAGIIILLTGAGGAFKQVLIDTGIGDLIASSIGSSGSSILLFAFLISGIVRILQGSATVAMITAAGVVAPLLEISSGSFFNALAVIAIASGATLLSHVNDSGFWLVNRYFGLTEKQTLASWSVMTSIIAFTGLIMVLILQVLFV
ncbi:MAG: Gnt-I system low-affinity gluconate transporter [Cyclobacteriaceae bacterium]|jgi:Gnt-I system low-affinity gluconate transporter